MSREDLINILKVRLAAEEGNPTAQFVIKECIKQLEEDTIYIIVSGEYSDWNIEGYAENEEDAEKICADHNAKAECCYDEWYCLCARSISKIPDIQLLCEQTVVFDKTANGWVMRQDNHRYKYKKFEGEIPKSFIARWKNNPNGIIMATIYQRECNRKKAEKIAQDMLGEFLYNELQF